jgi:thioredoxin 1
MEVEAVVAGREPSREEVSQWPGPVVLEFGASWCGHCAALRPHLDALLAERPEVCHVRIEDGKGKALGRSFRVKLWPTLVFLRDGEVVSQAVRPSPAEVRKGLEALTSRSGAAEGRPGQEQRFVRPSS